MIKLKVKNKTFDIPSCSSEFINLTRSSVTVPSNNEFAVFIKELALIRAVKSIVLFNLVFFSIVLSRTLSATSMLDSADSNISTKKEAPASPDDFNIDISHDIASLTYLDDSTIVFEQL